VLSKLVPKLYGDKPKLLTLGSTPYASITAAVRRDAGLVLGMVLLLAAFAVCKVAGVL